MIGDYFYVARGRQVFIGLKAADPLRAAEMIPLIQRVGAGIPGTFAVAKQASLFEQGLSAGRTVDVVVSGPKLETLIGLGGRIIGLMRGLIPGAQVIPKPSLDLASPELHVKPRWAKVADLSLDARQLGYAVDALVDGAYAGDYYIGGDKIDLTIVGRGDAMQRTQDLAALPVATPSGHLVSLGSVAEIRLGSGPEQINRRERQRSVTIEVSPPPEIALEEAIARIETEIVGPMRRDGSLDGGYRVSLAGTADKLKATWEALRLNLLLALLITYLLLAALFESWIYPLVIITVVPLGAAGGIAGLALLNRSQLQPLDVLTMLGFVILIGTTVNNAILIVHQALQRLRKDGLDAGAAVLSGLQTRIRPIFMTTLTTVLGLLPLVLFGGAGSELYRGLGAVVLGGLISATLLTIVLVPTIFHLAMRTLQAGERVLKRSPERKAES